MATATSQRRVLTSVEIPDRLYFKIGDVAKILGVETHVLRFWETQFPQLKPNKSGTGQRLYRRREVELAVTIKELVHDKGYTIAGARQALEEAAAEHRKAPQSIPQPSESSAQQRLNNAAGALERIRIELREISSLLALPAPQPAVQPTSAHNKRLTSMPAPSGNLFPS